MHLKINSGSRLACSDGKWKKLTPSECRILCCLKEHPQTVFTAEQLYKAVWHQAAYGCNDLICVHIHNLRRKIEENPSRPQLILSVRGKGYWYSGQ